MDDLERAHKFFEQKRFDDALSIYEQRLFLNPNDPWLYNAKGLCLTQLDRDEEALASFDRAIRLNPQGAVFFYHIGLVFEKTGDIELALQAYKRSLELDSTQLYAWNTLALLYIKNEDYSNAIVAYQSLLQYQEDNYNAKHMLLALQGENPQIASKEYIVDYFDSASSLFDQHLQENLHYEVPNIIASWLKAYTRSGEKVLDLGCGTGLVADNLKNSNAIFDGVDLSSKMLFVAKEKNLYRNLYQKDVLEFLTQIKSNSYEIVSAADLFIYIGNLDRVFEEIYRLLPIGGVFIFSTEDCKKCLEYKLLKSGRFAQAHAYIEILSENFGFTILKKEKLIIRQESDGNKKGTLWLLIK